MAAARPLVNVQAIDGTTSSSQIKLPSVLIAPIRADIVHFVHTNMRKNSRQAYAVSVKAGHQHSAESWGTGRAVSRIPRVSGSGTHRAGQAAFGNMCRKGRMFAPTKTWRKWHRKINVNQRRYAVASALAASALPSLLMARGHRINEVSEVPLVVSDAAQSVSKTKAGLAMLAALGASADVNRAKESRQIRTGRGKMRGRRHTIKRGPLVIYDEDNGIVAALRNLPGVDVAQVTRLNLLALAPGGHVGRFIIWTQSAFAKLDSIYGTFEKVSETKINYRVPRPMVTNGDISRIIASDEVQSALRPVKHNRDQFVLKKNPLKNFGAMVSLNPYAAKLQKQERALHALRSKAKSDAKDLKRKNLSTSAKTPEEEKAIKKKKEIQRDNKKFYKSVLLSGTNVE